MIEIWKKLLSNNLKLFLEYARNTSNFSIKIFITFIFINIFFYWFAMLLAYPELIFGPSYLEYFFLQIPVGILGGGFDSLSLIITIYMIKRAINSYSSFMYLAHLSVDVMIAFLATFWVLFVFIISGWLFSFFTVNPESLFLRKEIYEERVISAIYNPVGTSELKNIFFGIVMEFSAMIPTTFHIYLFLKSMLKFIKLR